MAGPERRIYGEKELLKEDHRKLLLEALCFTLPEKQAEKACRALFSAFGSLDGILTAPSEILREVPGVPPETVNGLELVVRLARACIEERTWDLTRIYDTRSAVEMFRPLFLGRRNEAVCVILLDGRGRAVYSGVVCEGSLSEVPLYLRKVIRLCIEHQATEVFLSHNHPSGAAFPSQSDLLMTDRLISALNAIDVSLCDHIIFANESYYSFADSGVLERQERILRQSQEGEMQAVRQLEARLRGVELPEEQN